MNKNQVTVNNELSFFSFHAKPYKGSLRHSLICMTNISVRQEMETIPHMTFPFC